MRAKLKIEETATGFRCRVCGRRFRTEEAAFYHQARDCSQERASPQKEGACFPTEGRNVKEEG